MLIIRRSKLYYTASGTITPVGGRPVHWLKESSLNLRTGLVQKLSNVNKQGCYLTPVGSLGWTLFTVLYTVAQKERIFSK